MFYGDAADYLSFLPEHWKKFAEIEAVARCVNVQIDRMNNRIQQGIQNKYVSLVDEQGAARWERILGSNTPRNSALQARRDALRAKLMAKPPINLESLKKVIESYMGIQADVKNGDDYTLKIRYRGEVLEPNIEPLYATLYEMIPADLLIDLAYRWMTWGEANTAYSTWGEAQVKTWQEVKKGL